MGDSNTTLLIITGVATAAALGLSFYTIKTAPAANALSKAGVGSRLSTYTEFFIPIFVNYIPISLIWLGFFLTVLTTRGGFFIPTLSCLVTVPLILIVDSAYFYLTKH